MKFFLSLIASFLFLSNYYCFPQIETKPLEKKIEIDNNAAERALRVVAVGRKNWLFAGSDEGGKAAADIYTVIESAKMNGLNPEWYLKKEVNCSKEYNFTS